MFRELQPWTASMVTTDGDDGCVDPSYLQPRDFLLHATTGVAICYYRHPIWLQPASRFATSHNDILIFATISIMFCYKHTAKCYNRQMLQWVLV